jgi:hypothetical protein
MRYRGVRLADGYESMPHPYIAFRLPIFHNVLWSTSSVRTLLWDIAFAS